MYSRSYWCRERNLAHLVLTCPDENDRRAGGKDVDALQLVDDLIDTLVESVAQAQ